MEIATTMGYSDSALKRQVLVILHFLKYEKVTQPLFESNN